MHKQDQPPFNLPTSFFEKQLVDIATGTTSSMIAQCKNSLAPNLGFAHTPLPYPQFLAQVHQKIGVGQPQTLKWPQQARLALSSIAFSFILISALFLAKQNPFFANAPAQAVFSNSEQSFLLSQKEEILIAVSSSDSEPLTQELMDYPASATSADLEVEAIISELDLNEI